MGPWLVAEAPSNPRSRISVPLAATVAGVHLIPLALVLWLAPGATADLSGLATATLPILVLGVAAQLLLLAGTRTEVGLVLPRAGAAIWTVPPLAAALALLVVGGGADALPRPGLVLIAAAVIAAVIAEEITFRGALFAVFGRSGILAAVFGSSVLFGAAHAVSLLAGAGAAEAGTQMLGAFGLGLVLAVVRLRTGSLLGPVLIHGLWNGAALSGDLSAGPFAEPLAAIVVVSVMLGVLALIAASRRVAVGL